MKKFLTYRTANIAEWIGLALLVASIFIPRPWDWLTFFPGASLVWIGVAAYCHRQGYEKGKTEALKVEITRVWSEQEPFMTSSEDLRTRAWKNSGLEDELNKGLAADKADEKQWGTDYWGGIMTEPTKEKAKSLAKASGSALYSRYPHCEWQPEPLTTEAGATK